MVTGLSGALFAELNGFVSPSMLSWQRSGEIIVFVILGGVGRLFGPLAGAALFILLESFLGGWTDRWQLVLGLVLLDRKSHTSELQSLMRSSYAVFCLKKKK